MRTVWSVLCVAFSLSIAATGPARAAELVMFESEICEWCDVWNEEVGDVYGKTSEAKRAPLRRLDIDDPRPAEMESLRPVIYTPTFVLMDQGHEVGRITGYPGEHHFWGLLSGLLKKLDDNIDGCPQPGNKVVNTQEKRNSNTC